MYDQLLGEISTELVYYLRILEKSSKIFQVHVKNFREKYYNSIRKLNHEIPPNAVNDFMKHFFIPLSKKNHEVVNLYLFGSYLAPKYAFRFTKRFRKDMKVEFKVKQDTIFIQIVDHMNKNEWEEMRKQLRASEKKRQAAKVPLYEEPLFKRTNTKKWPNIDLQLELYRMYIIKGKKIPSIEAIKAKRESTPDVFWKKSMTTRYVEKQIDKVKSLVGKL